MQTEVGGCLKTNIKSGCALHAKTHVTVLFCTLYSLLNSLSALCLCKYANGYVA